MKLKPTYAADARSGSVLTDLMRIGGVLQMIGTAYLVYETTYTIFVENVVRLIASIVVGVFAGLFTMGFAAIIDDIHAIMMYTAGYNVEESPEPVPEPEVVEHPARREKRKAEREQPEDYDPYDIDQ